MNKFFLDIFLSFCWLSGNGVRFCVNNRAKLNQKLFEPQEIQLLRFSFIHKFHIDISHKVLNLHIRGQEIKFILFQELDELDNRNCLLPFLVIIECLRLTGRVHAWSVLQEKITQKSMVLFEHVLNYLDVFGFHQLSRVKLKLLILLLVELLPKSILLYFSLLCKSSQQVDLI